MQILVVSATEMEIAPLLNAFPNQEVLITGAGSPQTLFQLCRRFSIADYQMVIQAGIAGSFNTNLSIGEVVAVKRDRFADLAIVEENKMNDLLEAGLVKNEDLPFCAGWLPNSRPMLNLNSLKWVHAVTVNLAGKTPWLTEKIVNKYHPDIESMEGAAFHFACREFKQPFLQLRAISNQVGERDKTKWKMEDAIFNLNKELINLITLLKGGWGINEVYNDHD